MLQAIRLSFNKTTLHLIVPRTRGAFASYLEESEPCADLDALADTSVDDLVQRYRCDLTGLLDRWNAPDQSAVDAPSINAFKQTLVQVRNNRMGFFMG